MDRRQFVSNSAIAMSSLSSAAAVDHTSETARESRSAQAPSQVGRPVRAVSIAFKPGPPLEEIAALVDKEGARGTDIIALPETFRGQTESSQETLDGPTITALAPLAQKHRTYILCPIDRKDGDRRFNSAVLLDRRGRIAGVYDKLYPFWVEEFNKRPPVQPGQSVAVFSTDFGRLGVAICFDVNWAPLWQRLSDFGAELVIWPSAYSAGRTLQARAIDFSYYVMSATWVPDCLVYDIDGEQLLYEKGNPGSCNVSRFTFDLDRCIFHQDLNLPSRLGKLLEEHGNEVVRDKSLPMEGCFVLKAKVPGVSARGLARQYGMQERRPYLNRSRSEVDKARGWQFS
ncbi:MAG TPA: carbon-nitrogen hydrolase family protein [Bryobacteraceae bacterium]|nr:carbon-nitrogen hydrolase family protein [Bryobacteraceae bacterium]